MGEKTSILEARKKIEGNSSSFLKPALNRPKSENNSDRKDLNELFKDARKLDFSCESVCRIDIDIHDIISRLKNRTGAKMGPLISAMLKECIDSHKDEIRSLLNDNKYL